jgi:hypothetical protein
MARLHLSGSASPFGQSEAVAIVSVTGDDGIGIDNLPASAFSFGAAPLHLSTSIKLVTSGFEGLGSGIYSVTLANPPGGKVQTASLGGEPGGHIVWVTVRRSLVTAPGVPIANDHGQIVIGY